MARAHTRRSAMARCPRSTTWRDASRGDRRRRRRRARRGVGAASARHRRRRGARARRRRRRHRARRRVVGDAVSVGRALHRRAAAASRPSSRRCSARWARSRATPPTARRSSTRRCAAASPRSACSTSAAGGRACTSRPARTPTIAAQLARVSARRSTAGPAWRDAQGRRAFAIPRSRGSDDPTVTALDQISFATWLDAAAA